MAVIDVIDNFLPLYQFEQLQSVMMGDNLPWFYNHLINYDNPKDGQYQFTHTFFHEKRNGISSPYLNESWKFFEIKLKVNEWYRIKANLNPRTLFHRNGGYHIDYSNITTAVYYVNTTNGYTKFKKGGKVKSVANRIVIFDSNLKHAGMSCTDQPRRVVLNFNWK